MESTSTFDGLTGVEAARRGSVVRRLGFGGLLIFIVLALVGVLGPRKQTVTTVDGPYSLTFKHGSIVRSGEPVPMQLTIHHTGGFRGPVSVEFDENVFGRFDFQNWYPNPDSETAEVGTVSYEFAPPDGDTLQVSLDARVAPMQIGGRFTYWVALDVDGAQTARTEYTVWVMP